MSWRSRTTESDLVLPRRLIVKCPVWWSQAPLLFWGKISLHKWYIDIRLIHPLSLHPNLIVGYSCLFHCPFLYLDALWVALFKILLRSQINPYLDWKYHRDLSENSTQIVHRRLPNAPWIRQGNSVSGPVPCQWWGRRNTHSNMQVVRHCFNTKY